MFFDPPNRQLTGYGNCFCHIKIIVSKVLITNSEYGFSGGVITETEAYNGIVDRACHSYNGLRTKRTETMYLRGGHTYVYLCYGIHHLFNIVCSSENDPRAILIRGIQPTIGVDLILKRRKSKSGKGKIIIFLENRWVI